MTASQRGKRNRRAGHDAERQFANYLAVNGWPDAKRRDATGWRSSSSTRADIGDIDGCERLVWQLKYHDKNHSMTDTQIRQAWRDAQEQAIAAAADFGILVERRPGKADPGNWWAWMSLWDANALQAAADGTEPVRPRPEFNVPARFLVCDLVPILHAAGYGDPTMCTQEVAQTA